MSHQEIKRYDIIKRLINKDLNGSEAAGLMGLSVRHTKRLKARVKKKGAAEKIKQKYCLGAGRRTEASGKTNLQTSS